ncbi:hypothetical protein ZWY2020_030451 [Hordeum vulgare]|nr:hypothetical protein ZWY2020_030451 [Hordeum vulgare]
MTPPTLAPTAAGGYAFRTPIEKRTVLKSKEDSSETKAEGDKEAFIDLRPLTMEDLSQAKNQGAASFAAEGAVMNELKQWFHAWPVHTHQQPPKAKPFSSPQISLELQEAILIRTSARPFPLVLPQCCLKERQNDEKAIKAIGLHDVPPR